MKKALMMVVIAAVFAVGSTQAAAIAWSTGNLTTIAVNSGQTYTTDWVGQTMSFYIVDASFDLTGFKTALAAGADTSSYYSQMTLSTSAALTGSTKNSVTATSANIYAASTTYYGFAIAQDANANMTAAGTVDYLISTTLWTGTVAANGATLSAALGTNFSTIDAVPEPTSMALLALGVVAVGLRRKFCK